MKEKENTIIVSDIFFNIFRNFNVSDQTRKMIELDEEELYLLLDSCIDLHDIEDITVISNFKNFNKELEFLNNLHDGNQKNQQKNENLFFNLSKIRINSSGENLPTPYTKSEVREIKLGKIFDD